MDIIYFKTKQLNQKWTECDYFFLNMFLLK